VIFSSLELFEWSLSASMEADRQVSGPFSMHPVKATEMINNMNYNNNNYEGFF